MSLLSNTSFSKNEFTQKDVILHLLNAPGPKGRDAEPIVGKTRLMKLLFLLDKEGYLEPIQRNLFDFQPYKYGPFDKQIYSSLEDLSNEDLIRISYVNKSDDGINRGNEERFDKVTKFQITSKGVNYLREFSTRLPVKILQAISVVKIIYGEMPIVELLQQVYQRYDDYTSNSVW